jgi:hypothetical protein
MAVDDEMRAQPPPARPAPTARGPARALASRAMWRLAPAYGRRRARNAEAAALLQRLQADLDHVRERHGEQIERLEELLRELVLAVESLRREIAKGVSRDET